MSLFELLARCMFDNAEREKRCSFMAVLVHVDFFFFPFHDRAMTSEVRHERACTSFWTSQLFEALR